MKNWQQVIENIELPKPSQKVYIWGAGNTSVLNHQGMLRAKLYDVFRVQAFLDSKLEGTVFHGFSVHHPDILNKEDPKELFVLISTTNQNVFHEIGSKCREKNISYCLLDAAILKKLQNSFQTVEEILDPTSRDVYCSVLSNRACAANADGSLYSGESYFGIPEFCRCHPNDIIIDCGAYVGDSAERFIWRMEQFKKYIAIEPDYENYLAMRRRFTRLIDEWNISKEMLIAIHAGVDDTSKKMDVENRVNGLGSIARDIDNSSEEGVQFWALDDLIPEGFTFLKADIESYEYRMLCGARESIRKYHPRMAICIYHNMIDMYSIPQLIHQIDPTYHLAVRHHSYGYEETVLYAY